MKIGLILGKFNPIHMGHLYMATSVLNENLVDEVVFVPIMEDIDNEDFKHKCFMVQLAIDEIDNCSMSSINFRITGEHTPYMILKELKNIYEEDELYLIVGSNIVDEIEHWQNGDWILSNFKIVVINRNNIQFKTPVDGYIGSSINISSAVIRYLVKDDKQIYPLVPKIISQYIKRFGLYKNTKYEQF